MRAIEHVETQGRCDQRGSSGEKGCLQWMPGNYERTAQDMLGYVPTFEPATERYVALKRIELWLDQGFTAGEIALKWNQGHAGKCSKGVNGAGVEFNSCAYKLKVLSRL